MESVKTALRVLDLVAERGETGVSDLARALCEPKSTVQRCLVTLHDAGWLRPVSAGARRQWALTAKVLLMAARFDPLPGLRRTAAPQMEALRTATQETIHLMLRDGDHVVLVDRLDSPQALRTVRPLGSRAPLHVASNGKAILAFLSEKERERYLAQDLRRWTPKTVVDCDALRRDLAEIRRVRFALSDGELDPDVRAVAAPIFDQTGDPAASMSISAPASRFLPDMIVIYGRLVRDAASAITSCLQLDDRRSNEND